MIKTGTVATVAPTQAGGYNGQNGYVYTFDMVVNTPEGQVAGEIGSKSQIYPIAVGQPITVDATSGQHGPRLKKINPQYQQNQPPQQQSYTPPPQAPSPQQQQAFNQQVQQPNKPDWDEIARGKVRCNLVCAVLQSGNTPDIDYLDGLMDYIFNGVQVPGGGVNTEYSENPPPTNPGDDVPF